MTPTPTAPTPAELTDSTLVMRADDQVATDIEGRTVILGIRSGRYHQLNPMGSRIWTELESPCTVGALCQQLQQQYAVDADTCSRDVEAFLGGLLAQGLVRLAPAEAANP